MARKVQRFCIQGKPTKGNSEFFEWETATICMFVPDDDKELALQRARDELIRRKWEILKFETKSTLIEERVREEGGEVWEVYQETLSTGKIAFMVFSNHFRTGRKRERLLIPARVTEQFIDKVVSEAGGRRLNPAEIGIAQRNADYLLGEYIFELKELQEEGLEKETHQKKLSELFSPYFLGQPEAVIEPSILSPEDLLIYLNIVGTPIHNHVRSASKQIKSTRLLLKKESLKGGIIFVNSGFSSYPHDLFGEQVERYARKDSKQLDVVIAVTTWVETNGFDYEIFCQIWPDNSVVPEVIQFKKAFDKHFESMMTDLVRGLLPDEIQRADPRKPVAFSHKGIDFRWEPPRIPLPWEEKEG